MSGLVKGRGRGKEERNAGRKRVVEKRRDYEKKRAAGARKARAWDRRKPARRRCGERVVRG